MSEGGGETGGNGKINHYMLFIIHHQHLSTDSYRAFTLVANICSEPKIYVNIYERWVLALCDTMELLAKSLNNTSECEAHC